MKLSLPICVQLSITTMTSRSAGFTFPILYLLIRQFWLELERLDLLPFLDVITRIFILIQ